MKFNFTLQKFFILVILATPLYLIKLNIFTVPVNLLDILLITAIILFPLKNRDLFSKNFRQKIQHLFRFPDNYTVAISLILLGLIVSTIFNDNKLHNFSVIKSWFVLPILFALLIYLTAEKLSDFQKILSAIYHSTLIVALFAIPYLVFNNLTYDHRLSAFYLSPNHLAMYLAPGLIISIFNLSPFNKKTFFTLKTFLNLSAIIILSIVVYSTYSYATWLAILGSFFVVFLFNKRSLFKKYVAVILFLLIIITINQFNSPKFQNLLNPTDNSSLTSRVAIWKSAGKILADNWLVGIGADNFQEKYLAYQKYFPPYPEWAVPQPHNLFLAFWLHSGTIGFVGFLWLIFTWLKNQTKIIRRSNNIRQKKLALITLTVVAYILFDGIIDTPVWKNDLALIFWLIIFIGIGIQNIKE